MNYLILGGAGFFGANLVRRVLQEPGAKVTVLDALEPHLQASLTNLRAVWDQIEFIRGDMRDETLLAQVVQGKDVIFNCAGQTSHPLSIQYPLLDAEINCLGNLKLLEAIRLMNPTARVIYTGSSTVIGKATQEVVDEDHGERPLDIYSANKSVVEKYYRIYNVHHGLRTTCLRFANLYGPFGKGFPVFGFVNYFISLAWQGQAIPVYGSGGQLRNVTHIDDACEAMMRAANCDALVGETFFATSEEHLSVGDIARTIADVLQRGSVREVPWPEERKKMEIENVRFSSARLRERLDWQPSLSFRDGMERTREVLLALENGETR